VAISSENEHRIINGKVQSERCNAAKATDIFIPKDRFQALQLTYGVCLELRVGKKTYPLRLGCN
jgi:hypothetical protein